MLEVWVARMLRASGAMLMCATAFFFFRDLAIARGAQPHGLATEVVVSGIALACLVFSWLFPRPWRLLLFASYCLLVLNFALSVVATHNLVIFFAVLCLVEVGAAALTPWEDFWQAGLNLVCLLAWVITAQIVPHAGLDVVDMSASLLAAAAIGQFTVRIRQQFTADNLAAGYKFRDSEARLRKILNASPEIISITRDNQVQHKLAESPATLGMIFDASTDSMIVSDVNTGLVIEINREFSRLTGYTREDAVGRDIRDLRLWNDRGKAAEFARNLHATNEVRNVEDLVRTKSGALVACLMSGALIDFGGRKCCLATTRDVTELERTRRRLEESEHRFRTIFTAMPGTIAIVNAQGICIELSQPLATSGYTREEVVGHNLSALDFWADPQEKAELDRRWERDGSVTGMELINSILDLAKIESGRLQIENIDFELTDLVDKTIATFGIRAHSKGLELAARIAPGVPEYLTGDPHRLRQILVNLIGNALKFTEVGEVVLEIANDPDAVRPGVLRFTVSDTGIGIPPDKLKSIFSSFTQADSSTTRKYGGTGLGLSIAQRLTALMGGKIWIKSDLGEGSSFIFTVPFGLTSKVITATSNEMPDLAGFRVLIVDDNPTNRLIARELVNSRGAEVTEAASGEEALEAVRTALECGRPIQMVLLDMRMPGMDGLEVATRMRTELRASEPLILMLSSDDLMPQLSRMKDAGLDAYLVKPISRRELYDAIARVLATAHSARAVKPAERITSSAADSADLRASSILVAEDSPDNRLVISAFLRRSPCLIQFAENGRQALELFKQNHYDLVLMDLQMPVMDGYASTRAIRDWEQVQRAPRTNIVALTASALSEDSDRAREAGCDAHVTKPIKKATLLEVIRQFSARAANVE